WLVGKARQDDLHAALAVLPRLADQPVRCQSRPADHERACHHLSGLRVKNLVSFIARALRVGVWSGRVSGFAIRQTKIGVGAVADGEDDGISLDVSESPQAS